MELARIEQALRQGPVDEPTYVPGAFGRARRIEPLLFASAVGVALVLGVVIGFGLGALRAPSANVGQSGIDPVAINRQLAGTWISAAVSEDEFRAFMLARGHAQADVDSFLEHDPIETTLQWGLDFDGIDNLVVFSVTGAGVTDVLSNGPYAVLPDGRLRWADRTCTLVADFTVSEDRLSFGNLAHQNCDADEQIAHDTFFGLASPYTSSVR